MGSFFGAPSIRNCMLIDLEKVSSSKKLIRLNLSRFVIVCRKPYNFSFILSNVVVDIIRVRINAIRFILLEADVRTFEIRIIACRKRNQNR